MNNENAFQNTDMNQMAIQYVEQIKNLLSDELWENLLCDCSKKEVLILWYLYRHKEANMTQLAEYIKVPLNTATGIVSRMEKRKLVIRNRKEDDKRVVAICLADQGMGQMQRMVEQMMYYGARIFESFSKEEVALFYKMMQKVVEVLSEDQKKESTTKKIRKITIN